MICKRKIMNNITEEHLKQYEQYLKGEERSQATVRKYLRDIRKFRDYLDASDSRTSNKEQVPEYKQYLNEHYKTVNANSMLAAVSSFFDYLGWTERKVRLFKIRRTQFCEPERELTEKDYERLTQTVERKDDVRMSILLQAIGNTGIRTSEFRFITVGPLETGRADIYNKGRSGMALLPTKLTKVLKKYCRKMGIGKRSILITRNGKPMDKSDVSKKMKELGRETGADEGKVFPHNLCHLFARTFYRIEEDVVCLMDLLGRSNINTTRIYTADTESQPRRQLSWVKLVFGQP